MRNWKSILLLVLVFFAGLAVGVMGTRMVVRRVLQQAIAHPERVQSIMERSLTRRLRLDHDQQVKLHSILTDTRTELMGLRQQFQPQAQAILHSTDEQISAILTPEQQTRYDNFKERNWPGLRTLRSAASKSQAAEGTNNHPQLK